MATVLQHITTAARHISVLQEGEQLSADAQGDWITELQTMLAEWEGQGITLSQLVGQDLAAGDTLPLPATHFAAIETNLALRMAPQYGVTAVISPLLLERADTTFRVLQGQYADDIPMTVEPALLRGGRVWWDGTWNG